MRMFCFALMVKPLPSNPEFGHATGGMAYVYVYDSDPRKASERATQHLESNFWQIIKLDDGGEALENNCTTDSQKALFSQAKTHGLSYVVVLDRPGAPRFN